MHYYFFEDTKYKIILAKLFQYGYHFSSENKVQ